MDIKERQAIQSYMEKAVERYGKMTPVVDRTNVQNQNVQLGKFKM